MTNIPIPAQVKISSDVLFQNMGDEYVLLNIRTEKYFGLDEVAARFWQLFEADSSTENAMRAIQAEFDVAEETLKQDLRLFLDKLIVEQLVTVEL